MNRGAPFIIGHICISPSSEKHRSHRAVTTLGRIMQRRFSLQIRNCEVRFFLDQQSGDRGMPFTRRYQKRRFTRKVARIQNNSEASLKQLIRDFRRPTHRRVMEQGLTRRRTRQQIPGLI